MGDDLISRLEGLAEELARAHRELGDNLADQKRQALEAWWNDESTSVTARERAAEYATVDLTEEILKTKGEIAALTVEWETVRTIISTTSTRAAETT